MRIKHKHTGEVISGTYQYWKTKVLPNKNEINYDIITHPDIVDVFEINPKNGSLKFIESTDRKIAVHKYLTKKNKKDPDKYTIKNADISKFDNLYRLKNQPSFSFFERFKKIWNNIPNAKMIYETITNSTISKVTSNIITTVIAGLLILLIWALYQSQLMQLWERIFS